MLTIDFSSKRAKLALRFFTYGVMSVSTIILTILAIFYITGYRFNQSSQSFEQGGLVQFRSAPEGATLKIDGKQASFKTPGRSNVPSGSHTVEMTLNGYRSWNKSVMLQPGQLLWLNYIRLVPASVSTAPVKRFDSLVGAMASPDHKWLVLQEKSDQANLTLVDMNDDTKPTFSTLAIPDAQLTKKDGKLGAFTIIEWDLGSRDLLVRHDNGDAHELLRLDRTKPNEAINLSQVFRLNISDAHFAGSNPNIVYVRTDDVLRRLDVGSNNATAALVTGLRQFTVYGSDDVVSFIAERPVAPGNDAAKHQVVGLYQRDKETVLRTYPLDVQVKMAYAEYFRHAYLALNSDAGKIEVLRDPTASAKTMAEFARFDLGANLSWLKFSNNGRMIVAGNGNKLATYDLEIGATYSPTLNLGADITKPLNWLDDYYLWTDAGDRLRILEFDGQNDREITTVAPGFAVAISQNNKSLFSIDKNNAGSGYVLQRSKLVNE